MKKRILWTLVSSLLVAALILSSCAKEEPGEQEEEEEEEEGEPTVGELQRGGTITVYRGGLQNSWDLHDGSGSHKGLVLIYDDLLVGDIDRYGPRGTNENAFKLKAHTPLKYLKGALAESWDVYPDRIVWHIRQGVMWHNQPPLNIDREFTAYDALDTLQSYLDGGIYGPESYKWMDYDVTPADALTVTDKYTLVLKIKWYDDEFLVPRFALGWGTGYDAREARLAGIDDWRNAVGTGPFMIEDFVSGSYVIYKRNPNWWDTTTINGIEYRLPFVDRLIDIAWSDEATLIASLRNGEIEFSKYIDSVYEATLAQTSPELLKYEELQIAAQVMSFPTDSPPFDDIRVRRALIMSMDRQAMGDAVYPLNEYPNFPVSPYFPASVYTTIEDMPPDAKELYDYDSVTSVAEAKRLLALAGYTEASPLRLELWHGGIPQSDLAEMAVEYWAAIGVETELKTAEDVALGTMIWEGEMEFPFIAGVGANPLLADWEPLTTPGEGNNYAAVDDPWFSAELFRVSRMDFGPEKEAATKALAHYWMEQAWYAEFPAQGFYNYTWPWVMNYYGELEAGGFDDSGIFARIWLDQVLKNQMGY